MVVVHPAKTLEFFDEMGVIHDFLHGVGIAFFGNERTRRQLFFRDGFHALLEPFGIMAQQPSVGLYVSQQRSALLGGFGVMVDDSDAL